MTNGKMFLGSTSLPLFLPQVQSYPCPKLHLHELFCLVRGGKVVYLLCILFTTLKSCKYLVTTIIN